MKHQARKRFGQNFLTDRRVIERIVAAIGPKAGEHVVEIGPGQAAMTAPLIESAAQVTAIEIDRDLAAALRERFSDKSNFSLIENDALQVDLSQLQPQPIKLVGNLPYNISTPLIFHFLKNPVAISDMYFMLQHEVAERICAPAGHKNYGRLSVAVSLCADTEYLFRVPPGAFNPAPKVQSAIIRLRPRPDSELDWKNLEAVLLAAFSARRKTLRNGMKKLFTADELTALDIDPSARPETLQPADFLRLSKKLGSGQY